MKQIEMLKCSDFWNVAVRPDGSFVFSPSDSSPLDMRFVHEFVTNGFLDFLKCSYPSLHMVVDDNGISKHLPYNSVASHIYGGVPLYGPVVLAYEAVDDDGEVDLFSMPRDYLLALLKRFNVVDPT